MLLGKHKRGRSYVYGGQREIRPVVQRQYVGSGNDLAVTMPSLATTRSARVALPQRPAAVAVLLCLLLGVVLVSSSVGSHSHSLAARHPQGMARKGLSTLPLSAQTQISEALGSGHTAFGVDVSRSGLRAVNSVQHLRMSFERSGVSVSSGASRLRLSVRAIGDGAGLTALGEVAPRASANRVVYAHRGLTECMPTVRLAWSRASRSIERRLAADLVL